MYLVCAAGLMLVLHFLIVVVEVEIKVVCWEVTDLDLVWFDEAAKVWLARKVSFAGHAVRRDERRRERSGSG